MNLPVRLLDLAKREADARERIRQLTLRGRGVLAVRWPEGRHLLDDFFERFHHAPRADEQVRLVKRALDILFAVSLDAGASSADVIAAWETAGRRKQTPMTENEIRCWLACEFPQLAPDIGLKWIAEEAHEFDDGDGRRLYFSNDDLDRLLHDLYRRGSPTALDDILEIDGRDERNLRGRIGRDLRIVEDEYKRLLSAESCSFIRFSDIWHVDLVAANTGNYTVAAKAIINLKKSVLSVYDPRRT